MHARNSRRVAALAALLAVVGGWPALAWQSYLHQALVAFSQVGELDAKISGKRSKIVFGANAPDDEKPKAIDHYSNAQGRAVDSFNAAVRQYKEAEGLEKAGSMEQAAKQFEESAISLGKAFHYIQDLAASEKVVDEPGILPLIGPKEHKAVAQRLAEDMVAEISRSSEASSLFRNSAVRHNETTFRQHDTLPAMLQDMRTEKLPYYANQARIEFARKEHKEDPARRDAALKPIIRLNLLLTVACMNRTIELFNKAIGKPKPLLQQYTGTITAAGCELWPMRSDLSWDYQAVSADGGKMRLTVDTEAKTRDGTPARKASVVATPVRITYRHKTRPLTAISARVLRFGDAYLTASSQPQANFLGTVYYSVPAKSKGTPTPIAHGSWMAVFDANRRHCRLYLMTNDQVSRMMSNRWQIPGDCKPAFELMR